MIERIHIKKIKSNAPSREIVEQIVVERPLEILISKGLSPNGSTRPLAVTMRTPGADEFLIKGFLFTEGIIEKSEDVEDLDFINEDRVEVRLKSTASFDLSEIRERLLISSSCGICGKESFNDTSDRSMLPWANKAQYKRDLILNLKNQMSVHQKAFKETGGLHAAALCQVSGIFVRLYEDIGRHNALDKLIGSMIDDTVNNTIILLSGRTSFEMVQKVASIGVGVLVSIGPPSSMAIERASQEGITLIGFLKDDSFNIYSCPERII